MERLHERLDRLTPDEQAFQDTILDIAVRISEEDARHARVRLALLAELKELGYDEDDIAGDPAPKFAFSKITTVVEAAPDEEAMLQAVLIRLEKRGDYDPLIAELVIATLGPHDTNAIVEFLESLHIETPKYIKTADGVLVECVACEDQLPPKNLILASCGHCYCGACLDMVFNAAVLDESMYPPSCCADTPLPIGHAKKYLNPELISTFVEKGVEFSTVDRTYCSDPVCSTFIPPSHIHGDAALCGSCEKQTCVGCKAPAHPGDCPADETLKTLLKHAEHMRWQRCYNCLRVVQRQDGCNHIDCVCGAGFCYNCGQPSRDEAPCSCMLENRRQHPNRVFDPTTGEEIMHNYRFYQRPADGSRPAAPRVREEDDDGWPVDMDQAERQRIQDAHAILQAELMQGWGWHPVNAARRIEERQGRLDWDQIPAQDILPGGNGWDRFPGQELGEAHELPPPPEVRGLDLQHGAQLVVIEIDRAVDRRERHAHEVVPPNHEAPVDLDRLEILRRRDELLVEAFRREDNEAPLGALQEVIEPRLDAPATPPAAITADEDPWNLANDPIVCHHPEWWNHQGIATCSVCETDSRRTVYCEGCGVQACRRCRDDGRVPHGVIELPWTGGEVVDEGANLGVRW